VASGIDQPGGGRTEELEGKGPQREAQLNRACHQPAWQPGPNVRKTHHHAEGLESSLRTVGRFRGLSQNLNFKGFRLFP
jgi:hypothetical protein